MNGSFGIEISHNVPRLQTINVALNVETISMKFVGQHPLDLFTTLEMEDPDYDESDMFPKFVFQVFTITT